jgi:hypothetical protein
MLKSDNVAAQGRACKALYVLASTYEQTVTTHIIDAITKHDALPSIARVVQSTDIPASHRAVELLTELAWHTVEVFGPADLFVSLASLQLGTALTRMVKQGPPPLGWQKQLRSSWRSCASTPALGRPTAAARSTARPALP